MAIYSFNLGDGQQTVDIYHPDLISLSTLDATVQDGNEITDASPDLGATQVDAYALNDLVVGSTYLIEVNTSSDGFTPVLKVVDQLGATVAINADGFPSTVSFQAELGKTYSYYVGGADDSQGDYHVSISTYDTSTHTLVLGDGISPANIHLHAIGDLGSSLQITVDGATDSLTLSNYFESSGNYALDAIQFADGTLWQSNIIDDNAVGLVVGDDNNNYLQSSRSRNELYGFGGDDSFEGYGSNTLVGGAGNDSFLSHDGDDTYIFNIGDGQDSIEGGFNDPNHANSFVFGAGVNPLDIGFDFVDVDAVGTRLRLTIQGTTDSITLPILSGHPLNMQFADGTVWSNLIVDSSVGSGSNLDGSTDNDVVYGLDGNDFLSGNAGDDTLIGGSGNDLLQGGVGNDTYVFNVGDGQERINNWAYNESTFDDHGIDTLVLGAGINPADIRLTSDGASLQLEINGTTDRIAIFGSMSDYASADYRSGRELDMIKFADGTVWTPDMIASMAVAVTGSEDKDYLLGLNGNDSIYGLAGDDSLDGGDGDDILVGGAGNDALWGGAGSDTYLFNLGDGKDRVSKNDSSIDTYVFGSGINPDDIRVYAGGYYVRLEIQGTTDSITLYDYSGSSQFLDNVQFSDGTVWAGDVVTALATIPTSIVIGDEEDNWLDGSDYTNDQLSGLGGADALHGGAGNDTLDGGSGADTLEGGKGDDVYIVDTTDVLVELEGQGTDTVQTSFDYTLAANVENLTLMGTANINGVGNDLGNVLIGNSNNNLLNGDTGADTLRGGFGNDTYVIDNVGDTVIEVSTLVAEIDVVQSSVSYTLSANLENLTLTGEEAITGTGNNRANTLTGNSAANTLNGWQGNDLLDGGLGADTLNGGVGNDTYVVDSIGDVVKEASTLAAEMDTVLSSVSYSLTANVENLQLIGTAVINGTGNNQANTLTGNSAANTLNGWQGNDLLDGGQGVDTLRGGLGNDTYVVDSIGDVVSEVSTLAAEVDTVLSSVSYSLTANVENLQLTGTAVINGTGNNQANTLTGNSAANTLNGWQGNDLLDGGLGADTLNGGLGNDTYVVDNAGDVVNEIAYQNEVGNIIRLSTSSTGTQADGVNYAARLSGAGNFVTWEGTSTNLASGLNGDWHLYVKSTQGGAVKVVDVAADGTLANSGSYYPSISGNGRYITFHSNASNLVANDSNGSVSDVFVKDMQTGAVTLVTADGNGRSEDADISDDGDFVIFHSDASNLVTGDTNNSADIFVKDLQTGVLTCVSTDANGVQADRGADYNATISGNGRYVVFQSESTNLVSSDTNSIMDVFVKDLQTGGIVRASTAVDDTQANGASQYGQLSADGRYVTFISSASNLVAGDTNNKSDLFRKDLLTGEVIRVSTGLNGVQANGSSGGGVMSADGNIIAFSSAASNLVVGDTNGKDDIFVKNILTGALVRVTTNSVGREGTGGTLGSIGLSADGSRIAFDSAMNNLVPGDTNGVADVFFRVLSPSTGADGVDTVQSSISYSLGELVENLVLTDTANINGIGNTLANTLTGNSGANMLNGGAGNDTLDGGAGADTLVGGVGNDTYLFGRGKGIDTIQENDPMPGNTDVLRFLGGVKNDQLWFSHVGNNLEISIIGTDDRVVVQDWYVNSPQHVEQIKTIDGTKTLRDRNVESLVTAMAALTPPPLGQTSLTTAQHIQLDGVIAANWI